MTGGLQAGDVASIMNARTAQRGEARLRDFGQQQIDQGNRRLGLAEQGMEFQQAQAQQAQIQSEIQQGTKLLGDMGQQLATLKDVNPEAYQQGLALMNNVTMQLKEKAAGTGNEALIPTIDFMARNSLSPQQVATQAGQLEATQELARAQGLGATAEDVRNKEFPAPQPRNIDMVSVYDKGGNFVGTFDETDEAVQQYMGSPDYRLTKVPTVQAADIKGATGLVGPETAGGRTDLEANVRAAASQVDQIKNFLKEIESTPSSVGIPGAVYDNLINPLEQVADLLTGQRGSLKEFGLDTEKVASIRANARLITTQRISLITGEQSGRYTDKELQIAEETAKALDKKASVPSIVGALKTIKRIEDTANLREASTLLDVNGFDLRSDEGVNKSVQTLVDKGYPVDYAVQMVKDIILQRGY